MLDGNANRLSGIFEPLMVTESAKISKTFSPFRSRSMAKGHWTPLPASRYLEKRVISSSLNFVAGSRR